MMGGRVRVGAYWPFILLLCGFLLLQMTKSGLPIPDYLLQILVIYIAAYRCTPIIRMDIRLTCATLFLFVSLLVQTTMPVLAGADEVGFHATTSKGVGEILNLTLDSFNPERLPIVRSAYFFPLIISLLSGDILYDSPSLIAAINGVLVFWMAGLWVNSLSSSGRELYADKNFISIIFVITTVGFSAVYWSSVFSKDITALALSVAAASCAFHKKYVIAVTLLVFATLVRNYAIAMAFIFYLTLRDTPSLRGISLLFSGAVLLLGSGVDIAAMLNWPIVTTYMFLSPNPANLANWDIVGHDAVWHMSPLVFTIEGLFFGFSFLLGIAIILLRPTSQYSSELRTLLIGLVIAGAVLTLVGHHSVQSRGDTYGLFVVGDNIVRKKLSMWPLLTTWAAMVIYALGPFRRTSQAKPAGKVQLAR